MNGRMIDMAIVGGGLAGGLIALAVHRAHPEMRLALFESGDVFGGNHRWSWFDSDLDAAGKADVDITAELGCATPWLVTPGEWTPAELKNVLSGLQ